MDQKSAQILIMSRSEDLMSPLMHPWSYFGNILELAGFCDGIVDFSQEKQSDSQINLNCFFDDFYQDNFYSNFSDLTNTLKEELASLQ